VAGRICIGLTHTVSQSPISYLNKRDYAVVALTCQFLYNE